MSQVDFSIEDVLRELTSGQTGSSGPEGASSEEIARAAGHTHYWAMEKLKAAIRAGRVICSGKRTGSRIDGGACLIPVYRVKREGE